MLNIIHNAPKTITMTIKFINNCNASFVFLYFVPLEYFFNLELRIPRHTRARIGNTNIQKKPCRKSIEHICTHDIATLYELILTTHYSLIA